MGSIRGNDLETHGSFIHVWVTGRSSVSDRQNFCSDDLPVYEEDGLDKAMPGKAKRNQWECWAVFPGEL